MLTEDETDEADFLDDGAPEVALTGMCLAFVLAFALLVWRFG